MFANTLLILSCLYIAPHVDSIKASGGVVAGLSLLSPRILQLTIPSNDTSMDGLVNADTKNKTPLPDSPSQSHYSQSSSTELGSVYEFILHPRSLYILQGPCRFQYAHAVLGRDCVSRLVPGTAVGKIDKRLSIMFRDAVPIKHVPKF